MEKPPSVTHIWQVPYKCLGISDMPHQQNDLKALGSLSLALAFFYKQIIGRLFPSCVGEVNTEANTIIIPHQINKKKRHRSIYL